MLKEIRIADIRVGPRHRRDMGDLSTLADCIRQEGLLQPIGVTDRLELVFGERRIRAVREVLRRKTNLARAIEQQVDNHRGRRTDRQRVQRIAQVEPARKTHDAAAKRAGLNGPERQKGLH
jgi:ParB family chromosome partitioning protein